MPRESSSGQVSDWGTSLDVGFSPTQVQLDRLRSGRFYFPGLLCNAAATGSANVIAATPFYVAYPTRFDRIGCCVVVQGTAAAEVRLGIYNVQNGVPGSLVLDAGAVAANTTGSKTITIDQFLPKGWYALTANKNENAISLRRVVSSVNLGESTTLDITTPQDRWEASSTYGALPASFGTAGYERGFAWLVALRAA